MNSKAFFVFLQQNNGRDDDSFIIPGKNSEEFVSSVTDIIQKKGFAAGSEAEALKKLSENVKSIRILQKKTGKLSEAINAVFGERAESAATLKYNGIANSLLDNVGIKNDMKILKAIKEQSNEEKAYEIMQNYFNRALRTEDEYVNTFINLAGGREKQGFFAKRVKSILSHLDDNSASSKNIENVINSLGQEASSIEGLPTITKLYDAQNLSGIKKFVSKFIRQSRLNSSATSHRTLAVLDFEKRVAEGAVKEYVMKRYGNPDMVQQFTDLARETIYNGTKNDFSSAARFVNAGKVDLWDGVIEFLFREPVSKSTLDAIEKASEKAAEGAPVSAEAKNLLKGFCEYRTKLIEALKATKMGGNGPYPINSMPSKENFLLTGKPITEMLQDVAKKTYNNKHWLKIFGIATLAVAAVTIIATHAFGRMKEQKLYVMLWKLTHR